MAEERPKPHLITTDIRPSVGGIAYIDQFLEEIDPVAHNEIHHAYNSAYGFHKNHPPRETGGPFMDHPTMVFAYLREAGCVDVPTLQAALWHDVPEDHMGLLMALAQNIPGIKLRPETFAGIELRPFSLLCQQFGEETAQIIHFVTKDEPKNDSREEKDRVEVRARNKLLKEEYTLLGRMAQSKARLVKLADKIHNDRTLPFMVLWRPDKPTQFARDYQRAERRLDENNRLWVPVFEKAATDFPAGKILYEQRKIDMDILSQRLARARALF